MTLITSFPHLHRASRVRRQEHLERLPLRAIPQSLAREEAGNESMSWPGCKPTEPRA